MRRMTFPKQTNPCLCVQPEESTRRIAASDGKPTLRLFAGRPPLQDDISQYREALSNGDSKLKSNGESNEESNEESNNRHRRAG